jgi:hypothetical protein
VMVRTGPPAQSAEAPPELIYRYRASFDVEGMGAFLLFLGGSVGILVALVLWGALNDSSHWSALEVCAILAATSAYLAWAGGGSAASSLISVRRGRPPTCGSPK